MARTGRPKTDNAKQKRIGIRISDEQFARLEKYAAKHNQTITQVTLEALDKLIKED